MFLFIAQKNVVIVKTTDSFNSSSLSTELEVYVLLSTMNHSCVPSVRLDTSAESGAEALVPHVKRGAAFGTRSSLRKKDVFRFDLIQAKSQETKKHGVSKGELDHHHAARGLRQQCEKKRKVAQKKCIVKS